ncbi:Hsp20/alpha crystallin family protein [Bradyrhizobium sp. SZCCHNR1070]|uniref:Hsp20/alpha crystallin family protein n=1 Tax=Bradyrhizobium sp. SZCCHNR1070 TaxID=3057361 RepID=UPI002916A490|nr:Hsp20/alpha crystallin family protein [Bradyrhizobium sp. SZCCHNR1070]
MAIRDLIPWSRPQQLASRDTFDPFLALHREVNRLFDDAFRGIGSFGGLGPSLMEGQFGWPKVELRETTDTVTISAELPGLSEKDVNVEIANGVLSIRGEKKTERNGEGRFFTERYYGAFERRIPLEDVQEDKAKAEFKNGVLTLTMPRAEQAARAVRQIPIQTA